jgi:hypothetical protein
VNTPAHKELDTLNQTRDEAFNLILEGRAMVGILSMDSLSRYLEAIAILELFRFCADYGLEIPPGISESFGVPGSIPGASEGGAPGEDPAGPPRPETPAAPSASTQEESGSLPESVKSDSSTPTPTEES